MGDSAIASMQASIADWDTSKPNINAALARTENRVSNTEDGLVAVSGQSASVVGDYSFTSSQLALQANESNATASLSSTYGQYLYDDEGNPIYEVDANSEPIYQVDELGHKIPYTGLILKYVDADGNLVDNPTVKAQRYVEKVVDGEVVLDENGNKQYEWIDQLDDDDHVIYK